MKVFLAATSLLPPYGGPAYSVAGLAAALGEAGVQVGLWAQDQSAPSTDLLPPGTPVKRLMGDVAEGLNRFGTVDILHDNGIWLPHNHRLAEFAAERGIPRIVSTRGMLEPWAIKHKWWKKRLAWWLYQRRDLMRARCHHATGEKEAQNVQHLRLGVPICVIPNGVDIPRECAGKPTARPRQANRTGQRIALFMGRIYPVKGLPMLIEAWARIRPKGWVLEIAGPDEAGHRAELERAVSAAHLTKLVSFIGSVDGCAKEAAFHRADLFVLPSHSESFGMAIAEALAHGVPVLTTNAAPWPMLPSRGCGWCVDTTMDAIAEGLRQATSEDAETLHAMGVEGRTFVSAEFGWKRVATQFVTAYEKLLH